MEGRYETLNELTRGSRFSVFRAQRAGKTDVVLKRARADRPELHGAERLRHEYEILQTLEASGAPKALEFTTLDGEPVLVEEDAGASNLAETLNHRPLPVEDFLDLAIKMTRAVGEAHQHSVIHRDICPENFVVDAPRSKVTLVDFDSATVVPAFAGLPGHAGELEGTLPYMAPEQTGRMKRLVDRRADLYALGATFYEMLTGSPPFVARDPLELVHAHAARTPYPPAIINPSVPMLLSDIVMRLLAKMPECRYQTAEALVADLEEARRQYRESRQIEHFELGLRDVPHGFLLRAARLYGRDKEARLLEEALERVRHGPPEVVFIVGPTGIGKSALVNGLREPALDRSRWISARGDLLRSNVPYAPLIQAFSELSRALLNEHAQDQDGLRERIQRAVAPNGGVLLDAAPELRAVLGEQQAPAEVGAAERENRFQMVFTAFVRALLAEVPSLVLFIDDLQWLDPGSLKLIRAISVDPGARALLTLCASRSEELSVEHPVTRTLESIRAGGARVTTIELKQLDSEALLAFLGDALRAQPAEVAPLADVIQRKTGANPFFVRQFLGYLSREKLLVFDAERARWTWDLERLETLEVTPNVAHLLAQVIDALPREAQRALEAAACVGNRFELDLLAHLLETTGDEAARALWEPVRQGLILAVPEGPRYSWMTEKPVELRAARAPAFLFAHDQIQEAAYRRLPEAARKSLHCRVGRWIERHVPEAEFEGALLSIVDQLDRCTDQQSEPERLRLSSLNARAGRKAHRDGALASALGYFQFGLQLLPSDAWAAEHHALWFELLRNAAECAGLLGDLASSERLVNDGLARTRTVIERAELYSVGVSTHAFHGMHARAIELGRAGLEMLGTDLPAEPSGDLVRSVMANTRADLRRHSERELLEAPPLEEPERAQLRLLNDLTSTWFVPSRSFQVVACRAADLTARGGIAPGSAVAYSRYAMAAIMEHDYEEGYRYGTLSVALAERLGSPSEACRVLLAVGGHVVPWRAPLAEAGPMLERSRALALESGDLEFGAYALANLVFVRMLSGVELNQVLVEAESALAFYKRAHQLAAPPYVRPFVQAIRCLRGMTRSALSFDDDAFEEARFRVDAADNGLGQAMFLILKLEACYVLGNPELAWKYAMEAKAWLAYLRTLPFQVEYFFYAGLSAVRLAESASPGERGALIAQALESLEALETWANHAPMNFRHKRDLLAAELARVDSRVSDALTLYQEAIERAAADAFTQDEALAQELCGRFHRAESRLRVGEFHLGAALDAYTQWGAFAKVEQLERDFPALTLRARSAHRTNEVTPALDYLSLVKLSEALTEELDFERLLLKLVRICGEAAGATRTVLVLDEGGLVERAWARAGGEASLEQRSIAGSSSVPTSLIEHVFRSREALVLADAASDGPFTEDPYVAKQRVRSVLAVPILRGERALGVLYFENNLMGDAFTPERAAMFRVFSAQMAIALENSRFFEQRKRSEATFRVLAETSAQLAETLDYAELVQKPCRIIVPALADWCVVDTLDENGILHPVAWAHRDPVQAPRIEALRLLQPVDESSAQPQGQVLRSNKPLLIAEVTEEILRTCAPDEQGLALIQSLQPRSAMIVPITARGRTTGVVSFVRSSTAKPYEEADLVLAEEIVRRFGLALENARLYLDLREAMRGRKERDRYLRMIFRQLPGAVWAVDKNLRVTFTTGRMLNAAGIEPRKLIGITVSDFVGTRDPTNEMVARHLAALNGEVQSFEYRFRGRWYAILIEPLMDQEQIVGCVAAGFDITEKREVADRLARSEHRLKEAQRVAHVGSFEWDIQPNVLTWSDELQRIYGFQPGEFAGTFDAFMERVPADEIEHTRKVVFDAYARLIPFSFEHRIVRKDGSVRVLHSRGEVIRDESGKPVRMVGTSWDVTEQRELFEKLESAVSRWEATVNATAEGILVVDLDGKVVSANQRLQGLWEIPGPIAEGVHHLQLLAPALDRLEDREGFIRRVQDVYARRSDEIFDVIRFVDGRVLEWHSIPQRVGEEVTGRVWSFRDVTERERLLHRALFLADATRLLASLDVEQALDGVARLAVPYLGDGCAIDLFGDGGPRRLIALSRDPMMPMSSDVHPTALAGNSTSYRVGSFSYLAVPLLMKGNVIGVITLAAPLHRRYTTRDLELSEELARRAALAIDNARLYRGAQEALRSRDEFLSIAAHEIRGPVHAIHMAIQSIRQAKVPPASMPKLLDIVERQDRRLAQFVDQLLDLGRSRTGGLRLEFEPVNLGDIIREVAVRLGPEAARSGSTLTITARHQIIGQWDKSRLDQVVFNLLSNAIKFGLGKPIEVTMDSRDGKAILIVKDHGVGISPEKLGRIFKPFERGVSDHYGGLGLGLYIVKTIVDALGGTIHVESKPDVGSTFIVELPERQLGAEIDAHLDRR